MRITISKLPLPLPDDPFRGQLEVFRRLEKELEGLTHRAVMGNDRCKHAYEVLLATIARRGDLCTALKDSMSVRALAQALSSEHAEHIHLNRLVLERIDQLRPVPGRLLLDSVYQFYLMFYNQGKNHQAIGQWLLDKRAQRNMQGPHDHELLGVDGPLWLVKQARAKGRALQNELVDLGLNRYRAGRFMKVAQGLYYVEQLKEIPVNQPHRLLDEIQKQEVYDTPYDQRLLGHKALEILIDRADKKPHESWRKTVLAIAGDPRVTQRNPKYNKWWRLLGDHRCRLVCEWMSEFDLDLFLEVLDNFSRQTRDVDLKRMFPSRKTFMKGLVEKGLVTSTRLYLSQDAERFLKRQYRRSHYLPGYTIVRDNKDKCLIYMELQGGQAHIVEGSHECYLWIYRRLHESAVVFSRIHKEVDYKDLTSGLNDSMKKVNCEAAANITHSPKNFAWQKRAIETLKRIGIDVMAQDVISPDDYPAFKRRYGVM